MRRWVAHCRLVMPHHGRKGGIQTRPGRYRNTVRLKRTSRQTLEVTRHYSGGGVTWYLRMRYGLSGSSCQRAALSEMY